MTDRKHTTVAVAATLALAMGLFASPLAARDNYEWSGGKWIKAARAAEGTPEGELALVRLLFEDGQYKKLVKAAKKFFKRYPGDACYEEVCMLAGRSEMSRSRYWQAFEWFEKQLNDFPSGRFSDRALLYEYEVAEAFLAGQKRIVWGGVIRLKATDEGLEILQRIAEHIPGTELAARSLLRVGDFYYEREKWIEAIEAYDVFLDLFGKSAKAPYAMGRAAMASWHSFEGVLFDDTPMLEAEHRFKTLLEGYPAEAKKLRTRQILKQIAATRAHKLYESAAFYRRTGKPSAAAFYYRQTARQFPGTQWARDAKGALAALGEVAASSPARPGPASGSAEKAPATTPKGSQ